MMKHRNGVRGAVEWQMPDGNIVIPECAGCDLR